jgi:hypothetical protein
MRTKPILEDRYIQQTIRHPQIDDRTLRELAFIDPTPKNLYLRWLVKLFNEGKLDPSGIKTTVDLRRTLRLFHTAKLKKLIPEDQRDILRYPDVASLEKVIAQYPAITYDKKLITWTYELEVQRGVPTEKSYYHCVAHCTANIGAKVDIRIDMRPGWLGWSQMSNDTISWLRKKYGATGLMKPVTAAVQEAVGIFLAEIKPADLKIEGFDELRMKLYQSWIDWKFPGYTPEVIRRGINFVRDRKPRPSRAKPRPLATPISDYINRGKKKEDA